MKRRFFQKNSYSGAWKWDFFFLSFKLRVLGKNDQAQKHFWIASFHCLYGQMLKKTQKLLLCPYMGMFLHCSVSSHIDHMDILHLHVLIWYVLTMSPVVVFWSHIGHRDVLHLHVLILDQKDFGGKFEKYDWWSR